MIVLEADDDLVVTGDIQSISSAAVELPANQVDSEDLNSLFTTIASYEAILVDSWSNITEVQTHLSRSLAMACLCVAHNGGFNETIMPTTDYYSALSFSLPTMEMGEHATHHHCRCGGHYKDGKCEECGSLEHDA